VADVDVDGFLTRKGNAILRWRAGDLHVLVDADDLAMTACRTAGYPRAGERQADA
jgi:hypothetical protein